MKRFVEALVRMQVVAVIAVAGLCGAAPAAAVQPVVKLTGSASLTQPSKAGGSGATPSTFRVTASFSTDTPGAELFTLQKAVVFFPDTAGTNGRLFPSCGAQQIQRLRGNVGRCPEGSKIGSGTVKAQALQLGVTAHGRVALFNSGRGKSVTFNIQTLNPAYINESIDAPLTRPLGKQGERLTIVVPHPLQEILSGVFVGVQTFDVTLKGAIRVNGVKRDFIRARTCPTRTMHGVFDFKDWTTGQTATITANAKVRCTGG